MKNEKRRQPFEVRNAAGKLLAMGVYYRDGNVQVLWRKSLGWTGEQHHSIANMFSVEEGATMVRLVDKLPKPPLNLTDVIDMKGGTFCEVVYGNGMVEDIRVLDPKTIDLTK